MATIDVYVRFETTIDGVPVSGGSRGSPDEIAVSGFQFDATKQLTNGTTWDVWTAGADEPVTDFDFLYISSDQTVQLEMTCDVGNQVGTEVFVVPVSAGIPYIMAADDSIANYTADFGGGTADVIDQIRVKNASGSTATVRVVLIT